MESESHSGQILDRIEGAWKPVLEVQPHAEFWVEKATIGYDDSLDEFDVVKRRVATKRLNATLITARHHCKQENT